MCVTLLVLSALAAERAGHGSVPLRADRGGLAVARAGLRAWQGAQAATAVYIASTAARTPRIQRVTRSSGAAERASIASFASGPWCAGAPQRSAIVR